MPKNIVMCFDGTNNQVRASRSTNVLRLYQVLQLEDPTVQIGYYDTGVGTFSSPGAWTPLARQTSRVIGLAVGGGLRQNLGEAYTFLMQVYEPGDRLFLFGFSRGAFTARGLAGMLDVYGLFRRGAENMVPYAVSAYARKSSLLSLEAAESGDRQRPGGARAEERDAEEFALVRQFSRNFSRKSGFRWNDHMAVHFLGLWDTVKATRALVTDVSWPYTLHLPHAHVVRHALSIDEWRRPYRAYPALPRPSDHWVGVDQGIVGLEQDFQDVWFSGVHSDVGGGLRGDLTVASGEVKPGETPPECLLSSIPLKWMLNEAADAGVLLRSRRYQEAQKVEAETAAIRPSVMSPVWKVLMGKVPRQPPLSAQVHASARHRFETRDPSLGAWLSCDVTFVDEQWQQRRKPPAQRDPDAPCCPPPTATPSNGGGTALANGVDRPWRAARDADLHTGLRARDDAGSKA